MAIDIGGTFTDVALEAGGRLFTAKVPTTADAPERGVLVGVRKALEASGWSSPSTSAWSSTGRP